MSSTADSQDNIASASTGKHASFDVAIIGCGIVGLATAGRHRFAQHWPNHRGEGQRGFWSDGIEDGVNIRIQGARYFRENNAHAALAKSSA
jgi:2-polyprenyl-6-methoxyphenol hydroxylase-like FAD-dependent oxidoreductase